MINYDNKQYDEVNKINIIINKMIKMIISKPNNITFVNKQLYIILHVTYSCYINANCSGMPADFEFFIHYFIYS